MNESKKLVTYFSTSGRNAQIAKRIARILGADTAEIEPKERYSDKDLDWRDSESRSSLEMQNKDSRPELKSPIDVSDYDEIYVGFPIWWYTAPRIIQTFLESNDFSGKKIIPFTISGGSAIEQSVLDDLAGVLSPDAVLEDGLVFREVPDRDELEEMLKARER